MNAPSPRTRALLGALALSLAPSVARAQQPAAPTPAPAAQPADAVLEQARERQRRGRALLEARDFNGALAEFQRVYELLQGHPRQFIALSNIGRCYQSMGQYDLAMQYYERYLREGGAQGEDRATVEASIAALGDLLGTLEVRVQGPARAEAWLDNRRVGEVPGSLRVPGGNHSLEVRAAGWNTQRREVQVTAREAQSLSFALERPRAGIAPAWFFAGAALTVGTLAVAGGLGGAALAARSRIDARLADPAQRFTVTEQDRAPLRTLALATDVTFGVAGALGLTSVVLAAVADWRRGRALERPASALRVVPVYLGGSALHLVGSF